eukprot:1974173-Rhodomonas_salina.1
METDNGLERGEEEEREPEPERGEEVGHMMQDKEKGGKGNSESHTACFIAPSLLGLECYWSHLIPVRAFRCCSAAKLSVRFHNGTTSLCRQSPMKVLEGQAGRATRMGLSEGERDGKKGKTGWKL